MIPQIFCGRESLPGFFEVCEKFVHKFYNPVANGDFQNEYFMLTIWPNLRVKQLKNNTLFHHNLAIIKNCPIKHILR